MNLAELVEAFRSSVDDVAAPPLWSDADVVSYLNEAECEACIRARLIEDFDTPEVTRLAVRAGKGLYDIHCSILRVRRAYLTNANRALDETSIEEQDATGCASWITQTGTPNAFIFIGTTSQLRIVRVPADADTLVMRVHRLPLNPMKSPQDRPEIHDKYHYRMLDWAFRLAYLKQDADTFDEEKAKKYEIAFTESFGIREDANVDRKHADKAPQVVKFRFP